MSSNSPKLARFAVGVAASAAVLIAPLHVASAREGRDGHNDRIGIGEVLLDGAIIGGIVAVAHSNRDTARGRYSDDHDERRRRAGHYDRRAYGDDIVRKCVRAVQDDAYRSGVGDAHVSSIRDITQDRSGWKVRGFVTVRSASYPYRAGHTPRYDSDDGKFTCYGTRGRVTDLRYSGIRGLR